MEFLQYGFMQRALISGLIVGTTCAFLSIFVTLRRMSFFSDAISHSALMGIALGLLLGVQPYWAAVVFCVVAAVTLARVRDVSRLPEDTLLGVLFATTTSVGVLIIGLLRGYRVDLFQFLFGDILAVRTIDIVVSAALAAIVIATILFTLEKLLDFSFNRELATVGEGRIVLYDYLFLVLLALTIAISIRIVGVILVSSLIIIPAAVARNLSTSFKQMLALSVGVGVVSSLLGLVASYYFNTASGPTIVVMAVGFFVLSLGFRRW